MPHRILKSFDNGGSFFSPFQKWTSWGPFREEEKWVQSLPKGGDINWALVFPSSYEVGSSNLGFHYVFSLLKKQGVGVERFFIEPIPFRSVDSDTALERFSVITASISYERDIPLFAKWLHRAQIPLSSKARMKGVYPLVGMGGALTYINPLPMAPLCDFIVLGDGESAIVPLVAMARGYFQGHLGRQEFLERLSTIPSFFVPSIHLSKNFLSEKNSLLSVSIEENWEAILGGSAWITPKSVFGKTLLLELQRGCKRGCPYCTLPVCFGKRRQQPLDRLIRILEEASNKVEFKQVGLVTPEAGDYQEIVPLLEYLGRKQKSVSFASLRVDNLTEPMVQALVRGGRRSLTIAPETGNETLRRRCGKLFSNALILEKAKMARSLGVKNLKLYFMLGLPGEQDEDAALISDLCLEILKETSLSLSIAVSPFVPKPKTPWAQAPILSEVEIKKRFYILKKHLATNSGKIPGKISYRLSSPREALEEFAIAWGDEEWGEKLIDGIEKGQEVFLPPPRRQETINTLAALGLLK